MNASVIIFGQLTDITKTGKLFITNVTDTDSVLEQLYLQFPSLGSVKFMIALNNNKVEKNIPLTDNSTIALMPPFSGG